MERELKTNRASKKEIEALDINMEELQELWENNEAVLAKYRNKARGMRSSQVACVVLYLRRKGIIE